MPGHLEPGPRHARNRQTIQGCVCKILDHSAPEADQMVMRIHIAIKLGAIVPVVHLMGEAGISENSQGVVDRVQREHRIRTLDLRVKMVCGGMDRTFDQRLVDGRALGRDL